MSWKEENNSLKKSFQFKNFIEAWSFMTKVPTDTEYNPSSYNPMPISINQTQNGDKN